MFQNSALPTARVGITNSLPQAGLWKGLHKWGNLIPLPKTWRGFLWWTLAMGLIAAMAGLHIWASLQIAQVEVKLQALQTQYTEIEQDNAELLWQISQYTSLDSIQQRAVAMGYGPTLQRTYLHAHTGPGLSVTADAVPAADVAEDTTALATSGTGQSDAPATRSPQAQTPLPAENHTSPLRRQVQAWWQTVAQQTAKSWQEAMDSLSFDRFLKLSQIQLPQGNK